MAGQRTEDHGDQTRSPILYSGTGEELLLLMTGSEGGGRRGEGGGRGEKRDGPLVAIVLLTEWEWLNHCTATETYRHSLHTKGTKTV